tara:strand:- start:906 stop:1679 length:774 start_codon:yes stop_codon:yes gene_type:complete
VAVLIKFSGRKVSYFLSALIVLSIAWSPVNGQQRIGATAIVTNSVTGTLGTDFRRLVVGSPVRKNEVIETGPKGTSQIIFADETVLTVAPLSKVVLDEIVFDPDARDGEFVISVAIGVMRFISGSIAAQKYRVNTPTGIIGIRGTIFDLVVDQSGATTVVLRSGIVTISNLANVSQVISQPGQASTVSSSGAAPTPPAPASSSVTQKLKAVAGPTTTASSSAPTLDILNAAGTPPVSSQVVTESTDQIGMPGSAGLH